MSAATYWLSASTVTITSAPDAKRRVDPGSEGLGQPAPPREPHDPGRAVLEGDRRSAVARAVVDDDRLHLVEPGHLGRQVREHPRQRLRLVERGDDDDQLHPGGDYRSVANERCAAIPEERGDGADDEADQRADDDRVAAAARRDLVRSGARKTRATRPCSRAAGAGSSWSCRAGSRGGRLEEQLVRVGDVRVRGRRLDRLDVRVVERDVSLEVLDLGLPDKYPIFFTTCGGERVCRAGCDLALLRLDADLHERVDRGRPALCRRRPLATACRRDPLLEGASCGRVTEVRDRVLTAALV